MKSVPEVFLGKRGNHSIRSSRLLDVNPSCGTFRAQGRSFSPAQRLSLSVPLQQSTSAGDCSLHLRPGYGPFLLQIGAAPASVWNMTRFAPELGCGSRLQHSSRPEGHASTLERRPAWRRPRSGVLHRSLTTYRRPRRSGNNDTQPASTSCVNKQNQTNKRGRLSWPTSYRTTPLELERRGRPRSRHRRNRKCIFRHDSLQSVADFLLRLGQFLCLPTEADT
jgi:hypothetical protein